MNAAVDLLEAPEPPDYARRVPVAPEGLVRCVCADRGTPGKLVKPGRRGMLDIVRPCPDCHGTDDPGWRLPPAWEIPGAVLR